MIETTIYSLLNTANIISYTNNRIYPTDAKEGTNWPFIVYELSGNNPVMSLAGPTGLNMLDLELTVETTSVAQQTALSNLLKGIFSGYSGNNIQGSFLTDESVVKIGDEQEGIIYQETQQYKVYYNG